MLLVARVRPTPRIAPTLTPTKKSRVLISMLKAVFGFRFPVFGKGKKRFSHASPPILSDPLTRRSVTSVGSPRRGGRRLLTDNSLEILAFFPSAVNFSREPQSRLSRRPSHATIRLPAYGRLWPKRKLPLIFKWLKGTLSDSPNRAASGGAQPGNGKQKTFFGGTAN